MLKSELIEQIILHSVALKTKEVEQGVNIILAEIIKSLEENKRVEIRGFGTFSTRYQKARIAMNPKINKRVKLPARYLPHFKVSRSLHEKLNETKTEK